MINTLEEIAELAEAKGFRKSMTLINNEAYKAMEEFAGRIISDHSDAGAFLHSKVTGYYLLTIQDWLVEVYKLGIVVAPHPCPGGTCWYYNVYNLENGNWKGPVSKDIISQHLSREQATAAGIEYALLKLV